MGLTFESVCNLADGVKPTSPDRKTGVDRVKALCPCHNDTEHSLMIFDNDGGAGVHCYGGCESKEVWNWFKDNGAESTPMDKEQQPGPGKTTERELVDTTLYSDEDGVLRYRVQRFEWLKDGHRKKDFRQHRALPDGTFAPNMDGQLPNLLMDLPDLIKKPVHKLYIVEGEKNVLSLMAAGQDATTKSGGANNPWTLEHTRQVTRIDPVQVIVIRDMDEAGNKAATEVIDALIVAGVTVQGMRPKLDRVKYDITDHLDDGHSIDDLRPGLSANDYQPPTWANTDAGSADYFAHHAGDRVIYLDSGGKNKKWHILDNGIYRPDDHAVMELAKEIAQQRLVEVHNRNWPPHPIRPNSPHPAEVAARGAVKRACSLNGIQATLRLAIARFAVDRSDLGQIKHPELLPVKNGVVDLKTGILHSHDPSLRFTLQVPFDFKPEADCKLWDRCMAEWQPDPDTREWLKRLAGLCATGHMQKMWVAHIGTGDNGKSVWSIVLSKVLGGEQGFAAQSAPETWTVPHFSRSGSDHQADIVRLWAKRVVFSTETAEGKVLDDPKVKAWTGGEEQVARGLNVDANPFHPQATLQFVSNYRLGIRDHSRANRLRMRVVPWDYQVPEGKVDEKLQSKLLNEGEGILRYIVDGAKAFLEHGLMPIPKVIREATKAYQIAEDVLGAFIADCYSEDDPTHFVLSSDIHAMHQVWAKRTGEKELSKRKLSEELIKRGVTKKDTKNARGFLGLAPRPEVLSDDTQPYRDNFTSWGSVGGDAE